MKMIVTGKKMKSLGQATIQEKQVPSLVLMERAALETVRQILAFVAEEKNVLVVCGTGNNGGDGIAVARLLHLQGIRTVIFLIGDPEKMTEETRQQWKIAVAYQVPVTNNPVWDEYTVIVDGIFGVGLSRPITGIYETILKQMNKAAAKKIAIDVPSGICADTGNVLGISFQADLTVTFAYRKAGLCLYPGRSSAGKIIVADIGIYADEPEKQKSEEGIFWQIEETDVHQLPARVSWGNKGDFGKVLLVAGSPGMCGAAYLSAGGALYGGAGMVKIQTVEENRIPLQTLLPEAMITCSSSEKEYERDLNWCDVLVIGPGLGTDEKSIQRMLWFLSEGAKAKKPMVLDADGLNLLAQHPQWQSYLTKETILTPHMGEMSRLTGISIAELKKDPVKAAAELAKKAGCICVLKDACTVCADEQGRCYLNLSGNSGMATAGSGDVLAGILAAMLCMHLLRQEKKELSYEAALGVYIHGRSGDFAAQKEGTWGMTSKSLLKALPEVLRLAERETLINEEERYGKI